MKEREKIGRMICSERKRREKIGYVICSERRREREEVVCYVLKEREDWLYNM